MTLASKLCRIKEEKDKTVKEELINEFLELIAEHPENKLLLAALEQADRGQGFIDFGRGLLMPKELQSEGFVLVAAGSGFHIRFDMEMVKA